MDLELISELPSVTEEVLHSCLCMQYFSIVVFNLTVTPGSSGQYIMLTIPRGGKFTLWYLLQYDHAG